MRTLLPIFFLALALPSLGAVVMPDVRVPEELVGSGDYAEGLRTRLTAEEVARFMPWALNAQTELEGALRRARQAPLRNRLSILEEAIRSAVRLSGERRYQLFMRFALNRGLLLASELREHADMGALGAHENAVDLLHRAITVGLAFYESDLAFQNRLQRGEGDVPMVHARFGVAFMNGMHAGILNVLDATAQYRLLYKMVEMANWDLARDEEAIRYSDTIVEAHELMTTAPEQPARTDLENLRLVQQLNRLRIMPLIRRPQVINPTSVQDLVYGNYKDAVRRQYWQNFEYSRLNGSVTCANTDGNDRYFYVNSDSLTQGEQGRLRPQAIEMCSRDDYRRHLFCERTIVCSDEAIP